MASSSSSSSSVTMASSSSSSSDAMALYSWKIDKSSFKLPLSSQFELARLPWKLTLSNKRKTQRLYLSLSLESLLQKIPWPLNTEVTISLVDQLSGINTVRQVYKRPFSSVSPSLDVHTFVPMQDFRKAENGFLLNNSYLINVTISSTKPEEFYLLEEFCGTNRKPETAGDKDVSLEKVGGSGTKSDPAAVVESTLSSAARAAGDKKVPLEKVGGSGTKADPVALVESTLSSVARAAGDKIVPLEKVGGSGTKADPVALVESTLSSVARAAGDKIVPLEKVGGSGTKANPVVVVESTHSSALAAGDKNVSLETVGGSGIEADHPVTTVEFPLSSAGDEDTCVDTKPQAIGDLDPSLESVVPKAVDSTFSSADNEDTTLDVNSETPLKELVGKVGEKKNVFELLVDAYSIDINELVKRNGITEHREIYIKSILGDLLKILTEKKWSDLKEVIVQIRRLWIELKEIREVSDVVKVLNPQMDKIFSVGKVVQVKQQIFAVEKELNDLKEELSVLENEQPAEGGTLDSIIGFGRSI